MLRPLRTIARRSAAYSRPPLYFRALRLNSTLPSAPGPVPPLPPPTSAAPPSPPPASSSSSSDLAPPNPDSAPVDPASTPTDPSTTNTNTSRSRRYATFYISNIFPVRLAYWDPRPTWAGIREEGIMERLHDIGTGVTAHAFRVESWEIARKDGGVFLHFSYDEPTPEELAASTAEPVPPSTDPTAPEPSATPSPAPADPSKSPSSGKTDLLPASILPASSASNISQTQTSTSPAKLFIPLVVKSAQEHGGFPFWLGHGGTRFGFGEGLGSTFKVYDALGRSRVRSVGDAEEREVAVSDAFTGSEAKARAGGGKVWMVKGRQWTEDMNRFPSNRLRVEFDGPDVSQEMLYTLFRPYGRIADIVPPSPAPAGALRYATISFSQISPAATAINCLHGFATATNTANFLTQSSEAGATVPTSRLRLYYERPLKAHAIRDWISAHPRLALPIIAFLLGTLSYTFFDPIRAFFVRSQLEGYWDIEKYTIIKWMKEKFTLPSALGFKSSSAAATEQSEEQFGKDAWKDRVEAEKEVEGWMSEYPSTFIAIIGPPGSGKVSLVSRVLKQQQKPTLVIDCAEIAKSKNDGQLVSSLAEQTGYWPVFSFLNSLNGLIDLASVGLIGQKAGFATPVDQQLRSMLETVGSALKDTSTKARAHHVREVQHEQDRVAVREEQARRRELIRRGGWHDGRLDCVAGNGPISELGLGLESAGDDMLDAEPGPPLMDDTAPIHGEAVPPTPSSIASSLGKRQSEGPSRSTGDDMIGAHTASAADVDMESEDIKTLPIVVLKNFAQRSAKGDLWAVISEWGASLVENKVAHVLVVTDSPTATKALTKALPAKPLNMVSLADANEANSLAYVRAKLGRTSDLPTPGEAPSAVPTDGRPARSGALSPEEQHQVSKLGGRMVDLETLVYKVRTGATVQEAVDDIIGRNTVELRKTAFGDDGEDAKGLQWSRAQAWKVVSELAKAGEVSYARLLQEFPFKGAEGTLKSLEEHEIVSVTYLEGRASKVKPGKPVFRYVFQELCNDPVFRATQQIEYNTALISAAETTIKACETELAQLRDITANGGVQALGTEKGGILGLGSSSAIRDRAGRLLDKMQTSLDKLVKLERENGECMKVLSSGAA